MSITVKNINKKFESFNALDNINLEIKIGELVALLGPSGIGKTTLLRIIAGLESSNSGNIYFNGNDNTNKKVQERQVGFVFQHYALFKHMTVGENVAFGLNIKPKKERLDKKIINEKVDELLDLIKMKQFKNRYPSQLSGGQRQRVALARALAVQPNVLLLDEPFGALDAKVRKDLRRRLRRLHDNYSITSIFVTHDQEEAMDVADKIVILNKGKIEQIGTPKDVYENPKNPFVYDFLGNVNIFHGRLEKGKINIAGKDYEVPEFEENREVNAISYVRPQDIDISKEKTKGTIESEVFFIRSSRSIIYIELKRKDNNEYLEAGISRETFKQLNLDIGDVVYIKPREFKVFIPEDYVI